jgi:hypothetical protein
MCFVREFVIIVRLYVLCVCILETSPQYEQRAVYFGNHPRWLVFLSIIDGSGVIRQACHWISDALH